eukprot:gnl/TRDRNA2_/TRDRNA2_177801_c0_seq1.p1 gnl/TRDRNA2_/TRDRNA2_177801_c0~~gnl/TRDRNA2_/TRDRNA2_177801_c0_seq1.p1  ORF type:complete len:111 (+),score=15.14 gnl/TRDRNA2_/TRDRNA2_177801_c0_seq1:44-376(+)
MLDEKLFTALARESQRRLSELNAQELANAAWAFQTACQLDMWLCEALVRAEERHACDFEPTLFCKESWALSQISCLKQAWSLLDHAKSIGATFFHPSCYITLLTACEQRG